MVGGGGRVPRFGLFFDDGTVLPLAGPEPLGSVEVHVPPPPDGSSGVTRWDLGEEFDLLIDSRWVRRVRVVRVTDTGPKTREYTLRELDDGHEVFQSEADEEVFDPHRVVRAQDVGQQGRRFGDAEGRHEGRQQVAGGDDGSRWRPPWRQQEHGPDLEGSGGEGRREEADREGLDGPVDSGRVREEQAGLVQGCGGALAEGPVLGEPARQHCRYSGTSDCGQWSYCEYPTCVSFPVSAGSTVEVWLDDAGGEGHVGTVLGAADDRRLDVVHVECGGGGAGGVAGPSRLPAPQDRDRLRDVRSVAAKAFERVHVPRVVADLLRLRDARDHADGGTPR